MIIVGKRGVIVTLALVAELIVACASTPKSTSNAAATNDGQKTASPTTVDDSTSGAQCDVGAKDPTVKDLSACVQECDRGIASACSALAERAERGTGLPKDVTKAVTLHERACELKDASSCVAAARMHASGRGVSPNRARQMELLSVACNLGDSSSCAVPARAYASGTGVQKDDQKAHGLWERACMGGVETACDSLDAGL